MRRDDYYRSNVFTDFTAIRKAKSGKRRKVLRRVEPWVFLRFIEYIVRAWNLETLTARKWSPIVQKALTHCYSSKTAPFKAALSELERVSRAEPYRCPYCLMRQPKTWDHFLAKEDFPEFAALVPNLVRTCDPCNRKKGQRFTGALREVINPYFDNLPDTPLLFCDVSVDVDGRLVLKYYILRNPQVAPALLDLAERHFAAFELEQDLLIEGATIVATFVNEITAGRAVAMTSAALQAAIEGRLDGLEAFPPNSWEVATFDGLLHSPSFIGYVNARVVPPQPATVAAAAAHATHRAKRAAIRASGPF
jgi:5-methylcytosine-specific restriction endonuclease McrA